MEVSYILDMHTNYLILEIDKTRSNSYIAKMILNNKITGLLNVELRCIDDKDYFYYDITNKASLSNAYKSKLIRYDRLKSLILNIINTLEKSREFLLNEEGFILKPDYIYIDKDEITPVLCYSVDYNEPLIIQFSKLIEYFMNKVDYKDEKAVLLVYALYKITKESNITLERVKEEIYKDVIDTSYDDSYQEDIINQGSSLDGKKFNQELSYDNKKHTTKSLHVESSLQEQSKLGKRDYKNNISNHNNISSGHHIAEATDEEEVLTFSKEAYIITAISLVIILAMFIVMFQFKLLHNSFGNKIDLIKVLCFAAVVACAEILLLSKIFNEDRKVVKVIPSVKKANSYESRLTYINDESFDSKNNNLDNYKHTSNSTLNDLSINNNFNEQADNFKTQILQSNNIEDEDLKTEILYDFSNDPLVYFLESESPENKNIYISSSPFIIGKNSNGVNHMINDTSVSRFHARLSICDDIINVTDLGSLNGTYKNGMRLKEHVTYDLALYDEILFSKCKYIVKKSK